MNINFSVCGPLRHCLTEHPQSTPLKVMVDKKPAKSAAFVVTAEGCELHLSMKEPKE